MANGNGNPSGHGTTPVVIEGEDFVGDDILADEITPQEPPARFVKRFCRMFPNLEKSRPQKDGLEELGFRMEEIGQGHEHPNVPAGFTYLGQFIDHDITADASSDLTGSVVDDVSVLENERTPTLDLDNVYFRGPEKKDEVPALSRIYLDDNIHLRVGNTSPAPFGGGAAHEELPNDLPRMPPSGEPENDRRAIIGDGRNDENLAVAQTHLAFIKFHNKIVDSLGVGFKEARELATLHYQSVLLHDFLPRISDPAVYNDVVRDNGRSFFWTDTSKQLCMPVEFSVAAYRLGHPMVRQTYTWNRVFEFTDFDEIFRFSRVSGDLRGLPTVASNWPIDWTRFHDFSDIPGVDNHPAFNNANRIDTRMAPILTRLPEHFGKGPVLESLAVRNLLRGRLLGLPTGQDVAQAMNETPLTASEVRQPNHADILQNHGFDTQTPLWYYVLREAEVHHNGERLGTVGSRIVVETFHALIQASKTSLFNTPDWKPDTRLQKSSKMHYTMADLLAFVDDLNPLGDSP